MNRQQAQLKRVLGYVLLGLLGLILIAKIAGGAGTGSGHSGAVADVAVTSGSEASFFRAVLADLGAPDTKADLASLEAWYPHENGSWPPAASDNPVNSTMTMPGSTVFNSVGVQNYASAAQGAQATAATLANGNYPGIVAALKSGRGLCGDPSLAGEFSTWSGGGYTEVC
jgi:hypothetical protein